MQKKYIKECLKEGKFRVSTLHKYHDKENLQLGIADKTEGKSSVHIDHYVVDQPVVNMGGFMSLEDCYGSSFTNCTFVNSVPNCFITCFSKKGLIPLKNGFGFGDADYSMRFSDDKIEDFKSIISEHLIAQGYQVLLSKFDEVKYVSKNRNFDPSNPSLFYTDEFEKLDSPDFVYQEEVRAVWRVKPIPREEHLIGLDIQDDRLKSYFF